MRSRIKSVDVELERITNAAANGKCRLRIQADQNKYHFLCQVGEEWKEVSSIDCALMSTEVVGGFTGVILGLYDEGEGTARFTSFDEQ